MDALNEQKEDARGQRRMWGLVPFREQDEEREGGLES